MTLIKELIDIPERIHKGDFVLRLTEGVERWTALQSYEFPLPPIEEQHRIAKILWAADDSVEQYATLLTHINMYLEAVIENLFMRTDSSKVLGDYCQRDGIRIGPFGSMRHSKDYQFEGVPVIMPADIGDGFIQE